jgi:hypothetical protein
MKLVETRIIKGLIIESDRVRLPKGVLCRVTYPICNIDELNANKRMYEAAVWKRVMSDKDIVEKLQRRALFGHAEHPQETQSNLERVSHVIFEMWADDKQVFQKIDVLDTPTGRIVNTILEANCQVGVSTRAEGDLEECEDDTRGKYSRVIPESYNYVTTDFTADPSTFGALPQDVKKNIVSRIGAEYKNESANKSEKEFAKKLLESMKCKKGKCESCGCCKALGEEKKVECESCKKLITQTEYADGQGLCPECLKVDAKESKMKIKNSVIKSNNVKENSAVVTVSPEKKEVVIGGAVNTVTVEPDGDNQDIKVVVQTTVPPPAPEPVVAVAPEEEYVEHDHKGETPAWEEEIKVSPEVEKELEKEVGLKPEEKPEEEVEEKKVKEQKEIPIGKDANGELIKKDDTVIFEDGEIDRTGTIDAVWNDGSVDINYTFGPGGPMSDTFDIKGHNVRKFKEVEEKKIEEKEKLELHDAVILKDFVAFKLFKKDSKDLTPEENNEVVDYIKDYLEANESKIPVANDSLVDEVVAGNILKDNKNVYFKVKSIDALGIALQPVEEGVEVVKFIEWDKVGGLGLVKVAETKRGAETEEIIGGPIIDETADIIAMYKAAGLPAPDGKGEHTKAFHKLAIEVAKGYVKSGDTPKEALDKAYPTAMKQLGRDKAVNKSHQRSESVEIKEAYSQLRTSILDMLKDRDYAVDESELDIFLDGLSDDEYKQLELSLANADEEEVMKLIMDLPMKKIGEAKSISTTAKQITDLRIKEAIVRAERDKLVDFVNTLTDNDLEVKILLKKIRESKVGENDEVKALCSKVEEKAKTASELKAEADRMAEEIQTIKKEIGRKEIDLKDMEKKHKEVVDKINAEHKKEVENIQKDNEKKITEVIQKTKDETIKAVVKEYVDMKLQDGLTVHDNVRALLEDCTTLNEVNESLEKVRDSSRWSALHSQPLKEVVVNKPIDPEQASISKRVGSIFNGFSNKG